MDDGGLVPASPVPTTCFPSLCTGAAPSTSREGDCRLFPQSNTVSRVLTPLLRKISPRYHVREEGNEGVGPPITHARRASTLSPAGRHHYASSHNIMRIRIGGPNHGVWPSTGLTALDTRPASKIKLLHRPRHALSRHRGYFRDRHITQLGSPAP